MKVEKLVITIDMCFVQLGSEAHIYEYTYTHTHLLHACIHTHYIHVQAPTHPTMQACKDTHSTHMYGERKRERNFHRYIIHLLPRRVVHLTYKWHSLEKLYAVLVNISQVRNTSRGTPNHWSTSKGRAVHFQEMADSCGPRPTQGLFISTDFKMQKGVFLPQTL